MATVQSILEAYATDAPYESLTRRFLEFERYTGRDPLLLVAEAAASTTGQGFATGVYPTVVRFREAFVDSGRIESLAELATFDPDDDAMIEAFGARRKRHVLRSIADVLVARAEADEFDALRAWATGADVYRYESDPIGEIAGVGPSSFQYLRILAGVDTVRPTPAVERLVESVAETADAIRLDAGDPLRTVASCELLAVQSSFRRLEIDRLAWWTFADEDEREAVLDVTN